MWFYMYLNVKFKRCLTDTKKDSVNLIIFDFTNAKLCFGIE